MLHFVEAATQIIEVVPELTSLVHQSRERLLSAFGEVAGVGVSGFLGALSPGPHVFREVQQLFQYSKGQLGFGRFALTDRVQEQLTEFFEGRRPKFDLPLTLHGTDFSKTVWRALQDIPAGQTRSYAQLAQSIARPTAMRAVARANGANQIAIVLPCHRVIGADGTLTGYAGGLWRKQKLIELERAYAEAPSSLNPRLSPS